MAFLSGYRVLDLTDERGLLAGRLLADLGADVVQVEPPEGSTARRRAPRPSDGGDSFVWDTYAANKRGAIADRDSAEGRQLIRRLATVADVVIESAGPSTMGPLGLDYADLRELNPGLVYVSITPFGRTGPKADLPASDLTVWAAGGPLDEHRPDGGSPLRISLPQAFLHAAGDAAAGAQLALLARAESGRGQLVDVSAQTSMGASTLARILTHAAGDTPREMFAGLRLEEKRVDQSGSGSATPPGLKKWECKDGLVEFHLSIGPASGGFTTRFIAWLAAEGVDLGRYAEIDYRLAPQLIADGELTQDDIVDLRSRVRAFFTTKTKAEVLAAAVEHKLLCVPILDSSDILASEQLRHRDFWVTLGSGERRRTMPGPFAAIEGEALSISRPAPTPGEHTAEVLAEWLEPTAAGPSVGERAASEGAAEQVPRLPLEGLKVLDFSWVVAGPSITRALADFGATVVRVESPATPETARLMQPYYGAVQDPENSALYGTWNAGKLGITLDLSTADGQRTAADLAAWADVVVESFSPGLLARWHLDYPTLSADHPDLIMLSASLNGQSGPLAKMAGYGNIGAALSGFQTLAGRNDGPPLGPFGPYTDFIAPRFGLAALLGAVENRRRTGRGCYIDLSQVEAGVWMQAPEMAQFAYDGTIAERLGNADREFAPHGVFPTKPPAGTDRHTYIAVAVTQDEQWPALAELIGRPDLGVDPGLRHAEGRRARAADLEDAVAAWTAQLTGAQAQAHLHNAGVPAHISADSSDISADPQVVHRGHLVTLPHARLGSVTVEGPRYLLSETPGRVAGPAPHKGEHNDVVLTELLGRETQLLAAQQGR